MKKKASRPVRKGKRRSAPSRIRHLPKVSPRDKPLYGLEALIATISDEKELLKALRKASKDYAELTRMPDPSSVS